MRRDRAEGAGKKSEVVTVRLDPKLKYLAELAARKHRRPLSSYIEWAVEQSLSRVWLEEPFNGEEGVSVADAERAQHLWDLDEPDRVVRLALNYPALLTHEEQLVWKLVREHGLVWKGRFPGPSADWTWEIKEGSVIWDRLREHWPVFKAVANGSQPATALPRWQKTNRPPPKWEAEKPGGDLDDEIPF
jgi:predicted transcriptional regulator